MVNYTIITGAHHFEPNFIQQCIAIVIGLECNHPFTTLHGREYTRIKKDQSKAEKEKELLKDCTYYMYACMNIGYPTKAAKSKKHEKGLILRKHKIFNVDS